MKKLFGFLGICTALVLATASFAWAQSYTTVDFPGAVFTSLNGGPNPQGTAVGSEGDTSGLFHGFTWTAGVFKTFDPPGSILTTPNYISPQGTIVGQYLDASSVSHGFVLKSGSYTIFDYPGAAGTALTGINPSGIMTGFYCSDPACGSLGSASTNHSFIVSAGGTITTFDPPGAVSSQASTINPSGTIVGAYVDGGGTSHGYQLYQGKFTTQDFPGSIFTFNGGNNSLGQIAGVYRDSAGVFHSFLLSQGVYTSFDPPGAAGFSDAAGINPDGVIVGLYADASGVFHGFVRTP
ncbi:MAG TPA: hypothetical protein VKB58_08175 [Terriglobales bacterium]|jgi:hypothetical protein|nr:hypothetical protein [Terriglobales bacterium]